MDTRYDLVAIGGGSGGLAVAERAAQLGRRVAVVDPNPLGGTCVNAGCVPKKLMWYAAQAAEAVRDAAGFGLDAHPGGLDWGALASRRDALLAELNDHWARRVGELGIEHVDGRGQLVAPGVVDVDGRRLVADHVVISTGSRPFVPPVPGAELGITSDGFFALREQPRRVAIVGAGYIGVELAGVLHGLGSEVALLGLEERVLAPFDPLVGDTLGKTMAASGIRLHLGTAVAALQRDGAGTAVVTAGGARLGPFDAVIWAVGRRPNSDALGLEEFGVARERGSIVVDGEQRTNVPWLHAVGDVTAAKALTPVAIYHGRRLGELLFDTGNARPAPAEHVPTVVFAHPPAGAVGLTEAEACASYPEVTVYETAFEPLARALRAGKATTAMKLVCAGPDGRVVGLHAVGDGVDELLQGFAVALNAGITKADLDRTVAIHPTSAEELVTLRGGRPGCAGKLAEAA